MAEVIDLTASSPPAAASALSRSSSTIATKRAHANITDEDEPSDLDGDESEEESEEESENEAQEPLEVPVPTLEHLAEVYPDREELYKHLVTLPQPLLSTMLMRHLPEQPSRAKGKSKPKAQPKEQSKAGAPSTLAHCVYCHNIYDKRSNDRGCVIEHWGDFEDEEFTCCGLYVYYESDDPAHPPPEEQEPFCYVGPHHDRLVEEDEYDDEKETSWWKDWEDSGNTCEEMNCEEELRRFEGIRK